MSELPIIDAQAIENLRALNPGDNDEFLREIAGIFLDDTPQRIAELEQSFQAADIPKFTRAAHSIKGSSSNLGAQRLRAAAEKLEHGSRKTGVEGAGPLISEIKAEYAVAEKELRRIIGQS